MLCAILHHLYNLKTCETPMEECYFKLKASASHLIWQSPKTKLVLVTMTMAIKRSKQLSLHGCSMALFDFFNQYRNICLKSTRKKFSSMGKIYFKLKEWTQEWHQTTSQNKVTCLYCYEWAIKLKNLTILKRF